MVKPTKNVYPLYVFADLCLSAVSFYLPYIVRYNKSIFLQHPYFPNYKEYLFIFVLWFIFLFFIFDREGLYTTDRSISIPKEITKVITNIFLSSMLIGSVIFFAKYRFLSRFVFTGNVLFLIISLSLWRAIKRLTLRRLIADGFHNINILIVGYDRVTKVVLEEIKKNPWWGFRVVGFLDDKQEKEVEGFPVLGDLNSFLPVCRKYFIDEVIVTLPYEFAAAINIIRSAQKMHLGVRVVPNNFEEVVPLVDIQYLGIIPLLTYKQRTHHPAEFMLKRTLDFIVSLVLVIMLSPLFFIISIFITMDSPGGAFYIQKRMGHKGMTFSFYKFRSMVKDADKLKPRLLKKNEVKDGVIFKIRNDPRITRIGRFLRRYSLDELPQLLNVLFGDMSLVGPRPFSVEESAKFDYNHMPRLNIKPGITGLSQIKGRSNLLFRRWIKWDLWYINNWSFWLDLYILWQTIPAVLRGKGAY